MASSAPVLLILGGGANVGSGVAQAFAAKGYKVASTSRRPREQGKDGIDLHIRSDLSDPSSVANIFQKVAHALGPPSVVVYNDPPHYSSAKERIAKAAAATPNPPDDPLSLSVKDLNHDFQVNTSSVLAAAREAKAAFADLPSTASRTFIYTGNRLNIAPIAPLLSLGLGKSATAHLIASASEAYAHKGFRSASPMYFASRGRFYYADERNADGSPAYAAISGQAHGDFYTQLAEGKTQIPWLATFVGGAGYVDFLK
ncbi:hypothetical protein TOPH_07814 [Tolypocladium ophioglossoides CBS 100239]|uniref:Uncharacterized protein n=1 Tax=Tolypocladium ophioglossoides (strain CBS 100239) TaxID=1163406 RepID=A0A0L0N0E1_TOLOC|nr:hypothetical protein TOPH_07814 [Tolypocladium ophioglossoides CBS 100239]